MDTNLCFFLGALPNNQKRGGSEKLKKKVLLMSQNVPGSMRYKCLSHGDTIRDLILFQMNESASLLLMGYLVNVWK